MASNKLRNHPDAKRSGDGIMVRASALVAEEGWNVRTDDADLKKHIEGIKNSLMNGGKIPPLQIYVNGDDQIVIVDGHCRNAAIQLAIGEGSDIEWVLVNEFEGSDADRVAMMFSSSQGKGLSQYESGVAFKRLRGFNWTVTEIAARVGKTVGFVNNMLKLANSDSAVQDMVKTGKVSAGAAVKVLRESKGKATKVLTEKVAKAAKKSAETGREVRVTEKDVDGVRMPKAFQDKLVTFFGALPAIMGELTYNEVRGLVGLAPEQLTGESTEVDMVLLVSLVRISDELQQIVAKQE